MADPTADFLDRLAHDLRGPLSPLQTASYLLKRPDLEPARQRELVEIVDRQSARLSAMVGEMGDWIRAQQQRLVLHREVSPLDMLVEMATGPLGCEVHARYAPGMEETGIEGDPQRLVQMLGTLGAFALSRAPEAPLHVDVRPIDGGQVELAMASPGEDIPGAVLDELFRTQQPAPFDDGLGLRLMVAGSIAAAHDGRLQADHTDDGLRIRLMLPIARQPD